MTELCDLQIHVNGQQTFFLNQKIVSKFSGRLKKIIKQENRRTTHIKKSGIEIDDFPGGPYGFELVSRFCYNNGKITITVSNVSLLHCCALFLGMTEKVSSFNLLHQTQTFLEGIFYWSWNDILICLKTCASFFLYADSCGLVRNFISSLLEKIAQNSADSKSWSSSTSSSSSSSSSKSWCWWFDDLTILPPKIIESIIKTLGAYGSENNSLVLTRFLLHYLKTASARNHHHHHHHHHYQSKTKTKTKTKTRRRGERIKGNDYVTLADTAVHGVILMAKTSFSCRGLFWVLRVVSGCGVSRECRGGLERVIGGMLDEANLDDLLVSGHHMSGVVYDINLVVRLIRLFVHHHHHHHHYHSNLNDDGKGVSVQKMKKVGRLIDKYLGEISPDHNLRVSMFLGVAESLPDFARDCFDGVYRAVDIYLQAHPSLSMEERSRLCKRCLNYAKLSLEACKDLAKNPRIPPRVAVQALASQHSNIPTTTATTYDHQDHDHDHESVNDDESSTSTRSNNIQMGFLCSGGVDTESTTISNSSISEENENMRLNLQRMQWRVVELEKTCRDMKGHMSRMVNANSVHTRALPRLC